MLTRTDPFRELDRWAGHVRGGAVRGGAVPMDAFRRGDSVVVNFDLPGVDRGSIELTVERNVLTVKAERPGSHEKDDEVLVAERPAGQLTRRVVLGRSLDTDRVEASYDRGVLSLSIPVAEKAKSRRIEIGVSGAEAIEDAAQAA
ncbi:MAG TPA: Hsp20/alpha crystallin family protein [Acidimicrobiales bacterium]|nr:Hsp20/alpha crystallin family protein [Acidimicrobiales bacterium]